MTQTTEEDRRMLSALRDAIDRDLEKTIADVVRTAPAPPDDVDDDLPPFVQDLIDQVADGTFDPYLEILLATLHNRKRRLRGARGF